MVKFNAGVRVKVIRLDGCDARGLTVGMPGTVIESASFAPWVCFDEDIGTKGECGDYQHMTGWKEGHMECLT